MKEINLKRILSAVLPEFDPEKSHHILCGQGNVWTEYMKTEDKVEYMALPRMSAMTEVLWTAESVRSYDGFVARLKMSHFERFERVGLNYRKLDAGERLVYSWPEN